MPCRCSGTSDLEYDALHKGRIRARAPDPRAQVNNLACASARAWIRLEPQFRPQQWHSRNHGRERSPRSSRVLMVWHFQTSLSNCAKSLRNPPFVKRMVPLPHI